jgi:hypothetical protein
MMESTMLQFPAFHTLDIGHCPPPDEAQLQPPRRRTSIVGHAARPRPAKIPREVSQSWPTYLKKRECALRIALADVFYPELARSAGVAHVEIGPEERMLTVGFVPMCSQSKLSQQELQDLQKATYFDKKELQQWYKGVFRIELPIRIGEGL